MESFPKRATVSCVFLGASLFALATIGDRNARSEKAMPVHGTLAGGKLFGFFVVREKDAKPPFRDGDVCAVPIANPAPQNWKRYYVNTGGLLHRHRHRIAYDSIWVLPGNSKLGVMRLAELPVFDTENPDREQQYRASYPGGFLPYPVWTHHAFVLSNLVRRTITDPIGRIDPEIIAGFGAVPTSATTCRCYLLNGEKQNGVRRVEKRTVETWECAFTWDEKQTRWMPKHSPGFAKLDQWIKDLDSAIFQKRVQATAELEKIGRIAQPALKKFIAGKPGPEGERRAKELIQKSFGTPYMGSGDYNFEQFPSLFAEDFDLYLRQDAYYFVTETGKLYVALPPAKEEKSRTMKPLWDDAKRPIVAVIEDADHDKVWLFIKDKNAGAKLDLFFEMKETIQTKSFDPKKLAPVNVEGRAKMLLEYLPLLPRENKKK